MKALRSFTVRPRLPEQLAALERLAMNVRWSWDDRTRDLFRWVDPGAWDSTRHDPVRLLGVVTRERFEALAKDPGFLSYLGEIDTELTRYLNVPRWFQSRADSPLRSVGYFSPEFGLAEALPQYSGGLGILAGDHLKAASDLAVPVIGVGLFYRAGYFRQSLNLDGWQQERFPDLDPYGMALTLCEGVRVSVDLAGVPLTAQVWRADVGRTPLYLMDADIDDNDPSVRAVTDRLYGGDVEHRMRQEILLGVGGVRALQALGHDVQVFHTNEGHAGFLGLERIRQLITGEGLTFDEAVEAVRAGCIFTTHTPVPAGIDRFPRELMAKYFTLWAAECGIDIDRLMSLGHRDDELDGRFNMAVMGLRLAARSNGVAKLHGEVSRRMFNVLWPEVPEEEVPIGSITNGVHGPTWVSPEYDEVFTRHVLPDWSGAERSDWARIDAARDDELWRASEQGRERLVQFVRDRLRAAGQARGLSSSDVAWCDDVLDPKALTVGFARRFATYKRATLLLSQPDRMRALLLSTDRPVQFVFSGKAHPADELGKDLIRQLVKFSTERDVRYRFVFLPDYDISVARMMYQGCDVWLNNPRRPLEACGTSGMKAALNGGLNCSILDGWWDEAFDGTNGWAISSAESEADLEHRDQREADSLFELFEHQIVPLYYERAEGPVPRRWVARMKSSLRSLGPFVQATRMVRDYTTDLYEPAAGSADRARADGRTAARELAAWKRRVLRHWDTVRIVSVETDPTAPPLGTGRSIEATLALGALRPDDVAVQLVHGPVGPGDEIVRAATTAMAPVGGAADGVLRYAGSFTCEQAGRYGYTVRVLPAHEGLTAPTELGRVSWAG